MVNHGYIDMIADTLFLTQIYCVLTEIEVSEIHIM